MFNRLKALIFRKSTERNIYSYFDGKRDRKIDPLVVYRSFLEHPDFNMERDPALIDAGDLATIRIAADAVRVAFDIESFDRGGLTEQECVALLTDFFWYIADLKKNIGIPLTLLRLTGSESSVKSTTQLTADSTSTGTVANGVKPPG